MSSLGICGRNFEKTLSYLKLASSNLPYCKVWCKNKNPLIWDQKCMMCVFLGWNLKILLSYLKSAPLNLSKMSF